MLFRKIGEVVRHSFEPKLLRREYTSISEVDKRISDCRRTRRSNCIGTALYISREIDSDTRTFTLSTHFKFLVNLERLDAPVEGCLIAWHERTKLTHFREEYRSRFLGDVTADQREQVERDGYFTYTPHMGIVTSLSPVRITHRLKTDGAFKINQRVVKVDRLARSYAILAENEMTVLFYLPRALSKEPGVIPSR